jgi:TRAP-type uncharacterized transport system substrate-binding protein
MRRGAFRGIETDTPQVAVVNILATHARLSDATVHDAILGIVKGADELGRLNPLFQDMAELFAPLRTQGPSALEFGGVKLHPGALAAYRDAGLLA